MRLMHMVAGAGCAAKLGPSQLAEVVGSLPRNSNPDLLVGFETSDDAGVFLLPSGEALVQTMDFFTPIVDDPFVYGQIAAANALSDVYAMGGRPLTVMNIACFDPELAPSSVWAAVLAGMNDKTLEAGAVCVGGHTIQDPQPKFGLSVTGLVDPDRVWTNTKAKVGDQIWLSKPLGTGIVTTASKLDLATPEQIRAASDAMSTLNAHARDQALAAPHTVQCATDITGFGLAGHLFNISRGSSVTIEIDHASLPLLPGLQALVDRGCTTGGGGRNRAYLGERLIFAENVPDWIKEVIVDPQTSGGLAVLSTTPIEGSTKIGSVVAGPPRIQVV